MKGNKHIKNKKKVLDKKLLSKENVNNKNIVCKIIISLIIFIVIGVISTYGYIFMVVRDWEMKIYPNIKIYNLSLEGLNKEEALKFLDSKYSNLINKKIIDLRYNEKNYNISYEELGVKYDAEDIINEALSYGKDKDLIKRYKLINSNYEIVLNPNFTFNKEVEEEFLNSITKDINVDKKEATIAIENGSIIITNDVTGIKVDYDDLKVRFEAGINGRLEDQGIIDIVVLKEEAKVKQVDLVKVNGKISGYKSNFYNNQDGRITNMKIASKTIDGTVLMPGEIFSYNELIGETTPEKGYALANTYVANKIVPDYGGGICQVSTALYRAVMRANIRSVERTNHSMIVSYSEPSLDATVANGLIDYKFKNTYNSPIYIEAYVLSDNVTINIYGNLNEKGNKTYELVSEIHNSYKFDTEYEEDNTIKVGEEIVIKNGMNGYESSSYIITYENGIEVNKEKISTDYYNKSNKVVKRGTNKE